VLTIPLLVHLKTFELEGGSVIRTLSVHWHVQIPDLTIDAEDFVEVVFIDVFGELLYNDL
jgi:hypothetical protein